MPDDRKELALQTLRIIKRDLTTQSGVVESDPDRADELHSIHAYLDGIDSAIECIEDEHARLLNFGEVMKLKPEDVVWIERSNIAVPQPDALVVNQFVPPDKYRVYTAHSWRLDAKRYNYYVPGRVDGWRVWTKKPTLNEMKREKWLWTEDLLKDPYLER